MKAQLKPFTVTLEERTVVTRQVQVRVAAESEADARVLAKYKEVRSWEWGKEARDVQPSSIVSVVREASLTTDDCDETLVA